MHLLVGDIHGCRAELERLLELARFDPATDTLVHVGDLVAKGPDSPGVVALCRELGAQGVRGNHDEHVLRWWRAREAGEERPQLRTTHQAVVEGLDDTDWAYLAALPLHLRLEGLLPDRDVLVVHGGLVPGVELGAQAPKWQMNLRSLDRHGEPSKRVDEGAPWAAFWRGPELVVFGHDAVRGLQTHPHAIGLDTGCCYGGRLTGLRFEDRRHQRVHVDAARAYAAIG